MNNQCKQYQRGYSSGKAYIISPINYRGAAWHAEGLNYSLPDQPLRTENRAVYREVFFNRFLKEDITVTLPTDLLLISGSKKE